MIMCAYYMFVLCRTCLVLAILWFCVGWLNREYKTHSLGERSICFVYCNGCTYQRNILDHYGVIKWFVSLYYCSVLRLDLLFSHSPIYVAIMYRIALQYVVKVSLYSAKSLCEVGALAHSSRMIEHTHCIHCM